MRKYYKTAIIFRFAFTIALSAFCGNFGLAQQIIGSNPNINAGFEGQAAGNLSAVNPPTSTTSWSFVSSGNGQNRLISASGGYGGPKYLSLGKTNPTVNTSTTANSNLVTSNTFLANTKYIVQFHYKQNLGTPDPSSFVFISADGSSANRITTNIALGTPTVWTKFTSIVTTNSTPQTTSGTTGINIKITGTANGSNSAVVDLDNFVVYPADDQTTPVPDITPPVIPGAATISNSSNTGLGVGWGATSGGVDDGGYLVIRYPNNPSGQPDPNSNAVYALGNSIGTGTVVFIGTATSFTDTGLSNNTTYHYRIYTVDKAFNYSSSVVTSGTTTGQVSARNYYIDVINGNDANDGTMATPYQNVSKLNSLTITPGSTIFLKAGNTWSGQQLKFSGSGTVANPIIIDKYGVGAKPIIAGNGLVGEGVVYLYNQSYIEINNLEITNAPNGPVNSDFFVGIFQNNANPLGADRRGVMIAIDNYGTANHIYLKNLDVHHVKGQLGNGNAAINGAVPKRTGGIYFAVLDVLEQTSSKSRFNDVLIDGCTIYYCENIGLAFDNEWNVYYPGGQNSAVAADVIEYNNWYDRRCSNMKVSNNVIHHIGKNAMIVRCTDETGLIEYNTCYETALGTTGNTMFTARAKGTVFQYNEGYYNRGTTQTVDPGNIDGSMYDPDFGSVGIIFQYSYSHDNSEGLYWGCNTRGANNNTTGIPDPGDVGCTLRYCISQNDLGDLVFFNYSSAGNEIYNNVFYIAPGTNGNIIHENSGNNHKYNYYNNIVYNNSTLADYAFGNGTGIQNRTISNNLFFGQHHPTEPADAFKIISDPMFVNPGSGAFGISSVSGYKLKTGSPAVASGLSIVNNGGFDYFGNIVLPTSSPNRGFFEGVGSVLPVQLSNFDVFQQKNTAEVVWTTDAEQNSSHFEIERSQNSNYFKKIGQIGAAGFSSNIKTYRFVDKTPETGKNYYRLRSVDLNGESKYSEIRMVNFSGSVSINVGPNPAQANTTLKAISPAETPVMIIFSDATGREALSMIGNLNAPIQIPLSKLAKGYYILKVVSRTTNEILHEQLFIKI